MSFTVADVRRSIEVLFGQGEHTVDNFLFYLKEHPVVMPPQGGSYLGVSFLVEKGEDEYQKWFVFKIKDRHFRASTESNSSFGDVSFSLVQEVTGVTVQATEWKAI